MEEKHRAVLSRLAFFIFENYPKDQTYVCCRMFVSRWGGKQFEYMGRATPDGSLELLPEEALFLIESSSLGGYWYLRTVQ